jgi:NAD kinase
MNVGLAHRNVDVTATLPKGEVLPIGEVTQPPISRREVIVVSKKSRLERECELYNLTREQLMARYRDAGESGLRIFASDVRQQESVARCKEELSPSQVLTLEELKSRLPLPGVKVIIALGGDDFLKLVSHTVDTIPVMGVNSDPVTSHGALLPITIHQLPEALKALEAGTYHREEWTRIRLSIDGKECGSALNDIVLGKRDFRLSSKHELEYRGEKVLQKSSGILISTGSGSTGWYASAGLYLGNGDRTFGKTVPQARFELREPQVRFEGDGLERRVVFPKFVEGEILAGETLRITSFNDDGGIASRDSLDDLPFGRGSVAEISVDPQPFTVIYPEGVI